MRQSAASLLELCVILAPGARLLYVRPFPVDVSQMDANVR